MYQEYRTDMGSMILWNDNEKVRWVPLDEANSDYQRFLEWVAAGNEPEVIEAG